MTIIKFLWSGVNITESWPKLNQIVVKLIRWVSERTHYFLASLSAKSQSYKVIKSRADVTKSQVGGDGSEFGHQGELTLGCGFMQSVTCHNIKIGSAVISHTD